MCSGVRGETVATGLFLDPPHPFGGVRTTTGALPANRFPGQWFQSESGLHQNWMRDYDPTTGRYIQADPLGLIDGASVYGYAASSPMRWTDPTGEFIPAVAARAALGVVVGAASNVALGYLLEETVGDGCYTWQDAGRDALIGAALGPLGKGAGLADDAARMGDGAVVGTAKRSGVSVNKAAGDAFRDEIADLLRKAGRGVRTEIRTKTPFGTRVHDIEVSIGNRVVGYVETKVGASRYTSSQRTKDFWISIVHGLSTVVVRKP